MKEINEKISGKASLSYVDVWTSAISSDIKNYDDLLKKDLEEQKAMALVLKDDVATLKTDMKDLALLSDV